MEEDDMVKSRYGNTLVQRDEPMRVLYGWKCGTADLFPALHR